MSIRPIALVVLAVVSANQASAGVIYDNGANFGGDLLLAASDFAAPLQTASDFMLSAGASTITDVHWSGSYQSSNGLPTDDFRIRFFADNAGVPAISPLEDLYVGNVGRTFVGTFFFNDIYSYQADIAPLTLLPNTPYWLSIVNNTVPPGNFNPFWQWAGGNNNGTDTLYQRTSDVGAWGFQTTLVDLALDFQLTDDNLNAVPEPASIATWAVLGLGAIGFRRRRKRIAEADERASR